MDILYPLRRVYWYLKKCYVRYAMKHDLQGLASLLYYDRFHKRIDWKNPKDLNEKINWLSFKTDTSMWTRCADKYRVREYVKECGCEDILVPLYGVWGQASDIDFASLPNKFVIKTNHGSGDVIIVRDKTAINEDEVRRRMQHFLETPFGRALAEPHYLKIKPCIICEKLLEDEDSEHPVDYKVWCFDGTPRYILTMSDRVIQTHDFKANVFDIEWNRLNEFIPDDYKNDVYVKRPTHLKEMLEYAGKLAKPFPQVRCDFYEVDGHIYFGELTFTSRSGRMDFFTPEALRIMGDMVTLPKEK